MNIANNYQKKVQDIQTRLIKEKIDGWLFYNFRESNVFATRILDLPSHLMFTRRYFYFIPAQGEPRKLVHRIEELHLDSLPGSKTVYLSWISLKDGLQKILQGMKKVAMEYSPKCAIPYVSTVDAGTMELVLGTGVEIVSSANLIQYFEAVWDNEQVKDNFETAKNLREIVDETFRFIRQNVTSSNIISEYDIQQFMLSEFKKRGLVTESAPNCSVNANSADPHYEPTKEINSIINKGDLVLLDIWAKKDKTKSVYADITWMGFVGKSVPDEYENIFQIVKGGRRQGVAVCSK